MTKNAKEILSIIAIILAVLSYWTPHTLVPAVILLGIANLVPATPA